MKILYFTKYTNLGASSRLRSFQFFPLLEASGFRVEVSPLFNDNYLKALYNKKKIKNLIIIFCYIRRFFHLFKVRNYDLIVIEKELFPYFPAFVEIIFNRLNIKYIVDYDDAIFHKYDLSTNPYLKILSDKIDKVMANSRYVFAGNSYLAERAKKAGSKNIAILPTVININKYKIIDNKDKSKFILGWIGSPSTYIYIKELFPVFYELKKKYSHFYVNIIGAKQEPLKKDEFINFIPWSENEEVLEINKFDIGIMPLHNTPWELGKCSYKLIQYMGCYKPIIGSSVGMNKEVIQNNFNGFLVGENDWFSQIEFCINNQENIEKMGINGRHLIENKYNVNVNVNEIIKIFNKITNR